MSVTYTDEHLAQFDKELEPYESIGKHTKVRTLTRDGLLRYMRDQKVIRLFPNNTFTVICDKADGRTTCKRFQDVNDKIGQWYDWCAKKEYAKKRELKELDALHAKFEPHY